MMGDDFTIRKFEWLDAVARDAGLRPSAARLAIILVIKYTNRKEFLDSGTLIAWPSVDTLAGILGMTLACQAEFLASRLCASSEVLETTSAPADLTGEAWVRPVFRGYAGSSTDPFNAVDVSGVAFEPRLPIKL